MAIFFTSDLHFKHKNVISYCDRPFKNVDQMNEFLINQWNTTVSNDDTIYVLGDFAMNPKVTKKIVQQLNGKKILISGNHDATFIQHPKSQKMIDKYLANGWYEVYPHTTSIILKNNKQVLLSHLPYNNRFGNLYDSRYINYKPKNKGLFLLHGHCHGKYIKLGNMIDVGWDAHHKILSEDNIIDLINDKQKFIKPHKFSLFKYLRIKYL